MSDIVDLLANHIRRVDGDHALGAALLAESIVATFGIVELPSGDQDDDGQTWFADCDIRVDHTGQHGPEAYLDMMPVTAVWLRGQAAEYLAAARDLEAES